MAMILSGCQSDNDLLCFKDSVSWEDPYFLQPCNPATTGVEFLKESSTFASFHPTVDKLSTASLDLEVTEYKPPEIDQLTGSSSTNPFSHSSDAIQHTPILALHTEMVDGDQGPLETLALTTTIESTGTFDIFEEFEELTITLSNNLPRPGPFDVSHWKGRNTPPFQRWIRSFCRKESKHLTIVNPPIEDASAPKDEDEMSIIQSAKATKTPSSSMKFVTAVKTASNTFASLSIAGGSTRRKSSGGTLDDATVTRMRDRRCALEELINTEEYYIADLKVLMNVSFCLYISSCFFLLLILPSVMVSFAEHDKLYLSVLNDCEWISPDIKDAIKRNVSEILDLHESLLFDIFRVLPAASHQIQNYKGKSLDISPQVGELERTHILSNPDAASKIAKVFDKMVRRK